MAKSSFSRIYRPDKGDENLVKPFMVERIEDSFALLEDDDSMGCGGGRIPKIERMAYEKGFSAGEEAGTRDGPEKDGHSPAKVF